MLLVALLLLVPLALTACGGNSANTPDNRQFASDIHPTLAPEATETPAPTRVPVTAVPTLAPSALLSPRGAPTYRFAVVAGTLIAVDPATSNAAPVVIRMPAGERLAAFAAAPNGSDVAVALESNGGDGTGGTQLAVAIYDRTGKQVKAPARMPNLGSASATATPDAAAPAASVSLAWSPKGDQILLATSSAQFVSIEAADLAATPIAVSGISGTVQGAWWSPKGGSFAVLVADQAGRGSVAVVVPKAGKARADTIWPRSDEAHIKTVRQVEWLPDGSGIAFTQAQIANGQVMDYQLYMLKLAATQPTIITTAGRAGPTADIGDFSLSPDGSSVAYTIVQQSDSSPNFNSLWIRSINGSSLYQVPVADVETVDELGWSTGGLVWNQVFNDGGRVDSLFVCKADTTIAQLATTGRPKTATPQPSPITGTPSPDASTPRP